MDTFTMVVFLLLIMIAVQVNNLAIAGVLLLIFVATLKSKGIMVLVICAVIAGLFLNQMGIELEFVMIGIVILIVGAVLLTSKKEGPGSYSPGAFGVI